jgi:hypothetical protein
MVGSQFGPESLVHVTPLDSEDEGKYKTSIPLNSLDFKVMASTGSSQLQKPHDRQPISTYEVPLHPEMYSIVSLATAHAQKNYFAGPLVELNPEGYKVRKDRGRRKVWAQLSGATFSIWDRTENERTDRQGEEVPLSYVNITDAVRTPYYLRYPRDSTKPSPSARLRPGFHNTACDTDVPSARIHRCHRSQRCWGEYPRFLLPFHPRSNFVGCCLPALALGEIAPRRDLYGPSHSDYH